jgi:hypothetical protein
MKEVKSMKSVWPPDDLQEYLAGAGSAYKIDWQGLARSTGHFDWGQRDEQLRSTADPPPHDEPRSGPCDPGCKGIAPPGWLLLLAGASPTGGTYRRQGGHPFQFHPPAGPRYPQDTPDTGKAVIPFKTPQATEVEGRSKASRRRSHRRRGGDRTSNYYGNGIGVICQFSISCLD